VLDRVLRGRQTHLLSRHAQGATRELDSGREARASAQDYTWHGDLELPRLRTSNCSW